MGRGLVGVSVEMRLDWVPEVAIEEEEEGEEGEEEIITRY